MKEWVLIKDLIGMPELAGTPQGIAQRAKKENWQRRRVIGQKGNVFEYYVGDMPEGVQRALGFKQGLKEPEPAHPPGKAHITPQEALAVLNEALSQPASDGLNNIERHLVRCFRKASEEGKVAILTTAETMASIQEQKEKELLAEDHLNVA
ncbi:hypothetical protein A4G20_05505 [Pasteurellaceae bacterium RH1A]|nr:hypothetical protein A4G20_05505 [Pasteurellaceae bacterium RH1A]